MQGREVSIKHVIKLCSMYKILSEWQTVEKGFSYLAQSHTSYSGLPPRVSSVSLRAPLLEVNGPT